mmetsp:Transcript_18560/g.42869  ORF Transcript_18560/g.42869 Transcript_18560/m.42869 type:complete len:1721 (-) Transcript_18560:138-5300(-)
MRLGLSYTNRRSQILSIESDEESTNSTSLVDQRRQKHRQQQKQLTAEVSCQSCPVTANRDSERNSSNNSIGSSQSDGLSSMGTSYDDGDDSSSSLPPPQQQQQQQHSQSFLTTLSLDDIAILTADCDIEEDPLHENSSHNDSGSGGKDRAASRNGKKKNSNSGSLLNRLLPQRQQQPHRDSSSSHMENEDDDDEEGTDDAVRKNNSGTQKLKHGHHWLPLDDSLSHEQTMSPQHQEQQQQRDFENKMKHNNAMDDTLSLSNGTGQREDANRQAKEHMDNEEYEPDDQQRPRKRGKQFSRRSNGSNGLGRGEDTDDSLPDENGDETDIEDDDDEDDDEGSDHEVPLWKPQDTQSVCEFTHTIRDYSAKRDSGCKKAEYSSTTVDNLGNKWRLIVYVNGNGRASNNHLSLFLQVADADDLPFGWKKAVSYVLTLEHPHVGAGLSYAKRNPDKTFKLCPKAIDWGWSQFITSDRIQQESFVSNDSLVVRASVTVKSSSVDIDLDDAELYLKCAVEEGRPDAVQLCLDQGASVNCQFKDDLYTPLHTACSTSPNEDGVNAALGSGGGEHNKPNNAQSKNNNNNIMATHEGSMQVLELLLEKGADGNACNKWRETPLLIAANNGHKAAVEALLKHGADPSLCSEAGWSALTFAAHKGYGDIVELLLDDGAPVNCRVTEDSSTPLHKACAGSKPGHLDAVKLLLESNADVHALNKWRETPLLTAANHGQAGAVEQLLRAGADPCKCTDTGWSPLSIAAYKGHDAVVKLLLEEGAPTEEADPTLSALLQAATKGLPDTVELLLRHGADHTVTTKKGDTALSILVEQNLIDAAVEMVTEYKASIPRCSRDRKKVQRARLLINLRLKQSGGESKKSNSSRKKKKNTAEQQARAAEEALLLELEQEDAERHKLEQDANKKSAKKRKKKERERQLKKEQEEKRKAEEKKEEEKRKKIQDEKDAVERAERQRLAAAQRKEDEENRRRQEKVMREQQQKEREQRKKLRKEEEERKKLLQQKEANEIAMKNSVKAGNHNGSSKFSEGQRQNAFHSSNQSKLGVSRSTPSSTTNANKRGWESLPVKNSVSEPAKITINNGSKPKIPLAPKALPEKEPFAPPRNVNQNTMKDDGNVEDVVIVNQNQKQISHTDPKIITPGGYSTSGSPANVISDPIHIFSVRVEPPAVSVFRREKISELLHRFSAAKGTADPLGSVDLLVAKKVLFRWIMRAAHESSGYVDFIIPSWDDIEKLTTFFQRQFIAETRKVFRASTSMEALKEAGTATAHLSHAIAKEVADFHRRVVDQLPPDWNDTTAGISVSEIPSNLGESTVVINWANQARVTLSGSMFLKLKERFQGVKSQLLSSIFVCKTCYDTKLLLVEDTSMDYSLTPTARLSLASELAVSAEAWSDPFLALNRNSFWGQFAEIDRMFGGLKPFGTNEDLLYQHGGSISVLAPPDNMLASRYLNRMVDILESCDQRSLAISFAVFLRSECLVNRKLPPSTDDLYMLEPRLRDRTHYISRVETLVEGAHFYYSEKLCGPQSSSTPSLFVLLQNSLGKNRYPIRNVGILEILGSMETNINRINEQTLGNTLTYAPKMTPRKDHSFISGPRFLQSSPNIPASPTPPQNTIPTDFDFGSIGRPTPSLPTSFAQDPSAGIRRTGPRRGRLFDLVDNDEEDTMNDVDVVSGMLGTLNVDDLFQSGGSQDVDIEAISLMGIGGSTAFQPRSNRTQGRFG